MDETILDLAKLCMNECQKIIIKVSHLKELDKDELMRNILPKDIYFNEIVNEVFIKQKKTVNKKKLTSRRKMSG